MAETTKKVTEIREELRAVAMEIAGIENLPGVQQIGSGEYGFPIGEVDGHPAFARISLSVCNWRDTEKTAAFVLDAAAKAYQDDLTEKAEQAAAKAAKKTAKKAK